MSTVTVCAPAPAHHFESFDPYLFAGRKQMPVSADTCIAFVDFSRMGIHTHKLGAHRRLEPPAWALNDHTLRDVIIHSMHKRATGTHWRAVAPGTGSPTERLARAQQKLSARVPALTAVLKKLSALYVEAKRAGDARRTKELGIEIENYDTQIRFATNTPAILAGAVYYYWRVGFDSVATAQQLGLKPPHIRQLLWRLAKAAAELGFAPPPRKLTRAEIKAGHARARFKRTCRVSRPARRVRPSHLKPCWAKAIALYQAGGRLIDIAVAMGYPRGHGQTVCRAALERAGVWNGAH